MDRDALAYGERELSFRLASRVSPLPDQRGWGRTFLRTMSILSKQVRAPTAKRTMSRNVAMLVLTLPPKENRKKIDRKIAI
jgi:hypothetical protein